MKKREWMIVFLPVVATWAIDRITKIWAVSLEGIHAFGSFGFVLRHNPGAMLGLFSEIPPVLRVVSLSTGGAFLICTYALIQYLLPIKSLGLRIGMSILLGGILGNVTDRVLWGYVIDFIVIGNVELSSPAFNLADALQWIGYALIIWSIVRDGALLWPEFDTRRAYWINPTFQLKYCFLLMGMGLGISLIALVFSYTYLRVTMIELVGSDQHLLDKFLLPYTLTFLVLSVGFSVGLFAVGRVISHKIAGPIFAFEKFVREIVEGKQASFKLRSKDDFKELEVLADKLLTKTWTLQKNGSTETDPSSEDPIR